MRQDRDFPVRLQQDAVQAGSQMLMRDGVLRLQNNEAAAKDARLPAMQVFSAVN